jgi:hypothetical protein
MKIENEELKIEKIELSQMALCRFCMFFVRPGGPNKEHTKAKIGVFAFVLE